MNPLDGVSLDLALGVALAAVSARFVSLLRLTLDIPGLHRSVLTLLETDPISLPARLQRLSYTSPYAEAVLALVDRDLRGTAFSIQDGERRDLLHHAELRTRREALSHSRRGQTLDFVGLLLLAGGLIAGPRPWSSQPLSLALGLGTLGVLALTLITRRVLVQRLSLALADVRQALAARPSLGPELQHCPLCGQTELTSCELLVVGEEDQGPVAGSRCANCQSVFASLREPYDPASSPDASSPVASSPDASSPVASTS